jgi:hypothetical protein
MIRILGSTWWVAVGGVALLSAACAAPDMGTAQSGGSALSGGSKSKSSKSTSSSDSSPQKSATASSDGPPSDDEGPPSDDGNGNGGASSSSSPYSCSPAGIAAYADALAKATRQTCTTKGIGVVTQSNYTCIKKAIDQVAPPNADASFNIVKTLLATNTQFPMYECTYFVQTVTAGVCDAPISPSDMAWTDYPLAHEFAGKQIDGYTWTANDGSLDAQVGDICVRDSSGGEDPGHIMIVAQVVGNGRYRMAEANELNPDGSPETDETGAVTNVRITTLDDQEEPIAGCFRRNGK